MDVGAVAAWFWQRISEPTATGCREWMRGRDSGGYGMTSIAVGGRKLRAHQVSYLLAHGSLPAPGMTIDHLCRNRACAEPTHLEAVTFNENIRRGGIFRRKEWCKAGRHRLAIERSPGGCKACRREKARAATQRYRAEHPVAPFRRVLCRAYLHPLKEPNLYFGPDGKRQCLACRKARIARQVIAARERRLAS